jgi:hypothetical protein
MTDSGPSSPVSKAFSEVDAMMNLIYAEILVNVFASIMILLQTWSNFAMPPNTAKIVTRVTSFFEMLTSLSEVAISVLALQNLDSIIGSLDTVLMELSVSTDNLDLSAVAAMCLLPCCIQSTTSHTTGSFPIAKELVSSSVQLHQLNSTKHAPPPSIASQ